MIKQHLPDILRVALSIHKGTIDPSAILQRLGSGSRKNRLYFAFRELRRAVKTCLILSPCRRKHINRFGDYRLDLDRPVAKLDYELVIPVKAGG